ncbi:hypothetical protein IQ22_03359 [Pseudomonas duriflava]|uniref:Uncharacterized protein n=1 Tax=Pseudomonas duriflava TaxID=459528 RepID=A0A562Q790_9PSED|nr:hypothetical protein [Pseudomonas duriflava]TWI52589.1 hypothetical protein IQ22_03359 [Pseudomonas duriflava]
MTTDDNAAIGSVDDQPFDKTASNNKRLEARQAVLHDPNVLDCTVYRPDEIDPDAEPIDLGDGKILFTGVFRTPEEWDEEVRNDFYGDIDPELFMTAHLECEAEPRTANFFMPESGDLVAVMPGAGVVEMFYVYDYNEDDNGRTYILIKEIDTME